jgi:hypothetical protein
VPEEIDAKPYKPLPRVRPHFKAGVEQSGYTRVWLVDDQGRVLHTEPVCSVPTASIGHKWFVEWLEQQPCPVIMPGFPDE